MKNLIALIASVCLLLNGCATALTCVEFPAMVPMSGTILDMAGFTCGVEGYKVEWYIALLAFVDLPLSLAADVCLLPISIPCNIFFVNGSFPF